jgi:MoxR-like ATPase
MLQPASRQLFGRERELAVLIRALADSERGTARIVWIGGEPGIGKTRLAEELGKWLFVIARNSSFVSPHCSGLRFTDYTSRRRDGVRCSSDGRPDG